MTRKDYVKLAEAFKDTRPAIIVDGLGHEVWANCVVAIANVLRDDNPRFNRIRFYDACWGKP